MDGQLVAVKMISPDRIEDFNAFKKVRLPVFLIDFLSTSVFDTEIML